MMVWGSGTAFSREQKQEVLWLALLTGADAEEIPALAMFPEVFQAIVKAKRLIPSLSLCLNVWVFNCRGVLGENADLFETTVGKSTINKVVSVVD